MASFTFSVDARALRVLRSAPAGGAMDFAGMMKAYQRHYGTAAQPNKPSRSTVQVAALVAPGALIEVEVTAAKKR